MISFALSKGRILDETLPLLKAAGVVAAEHPDASRKLIIATSRKDVRLIIVRATDVPTYVQYGAADLGVGERQPHALAQRLADLRHRHRPVLAKPFTESLFAAALLRTIGA